MIKLCECYAVKNHGYRFFFCEEMGIVFIGGEIYGIWKGKKKHNGQ